MGREIVQRFLPPAAIAIITAMTFFFWSHQSRRARVNSERSDSDDGKDDASPPPPVREDGFQYDVFLSFRGPDTRKGFTGHLYQALKEKGIITFIDSETLEKGQNVEELYGCIERSKILMPIFSKGYADSKWCLKEIDKMVKCNRLIIPVFFDVNPKAVCHQIGSFESPFRRYRKSERIDKGEVSKWSDALRRAGRISGYNLADTEGNEAKLILLIVKRILTEVSKTSLFVAKHPVGLNSRIEDVEKMLNVEAQDVRMVWIHGMGGRGKTTLAKAVYNKISSHFDACGFIPDIREVAERPSKLVSLQEQLLYDVFKDLNVKVNSISQGIGIISRRLQITKVLLVLDDVDNESQLDALAGSLNWFHPGSRIIITTRNKGLLREPRAKQSHVYEVKELDPDQSLKLFSWHAFGIEQPVEDFADLSKEATSIAGGLPLALAIFGSHFFDLKTVKEWRVMLERLKEDQDKEIHQRLRISFDALDAKERNLFLDIACFFVGLERELPTLMWEDCRFFPDISIKVLMHKSLLSINYDTGKFEMHEHIRDMGRKIVEEKSLSNPGMYGRRLWKEDEILDLLQKGRRATNIEAIQLFRGKTDSMSVDAETFASMSQLRMLRLGKVTLKGKYERFPKRLRWLQWTLCDLDSLPGALPLENVIVLDLSWSSITQNLRMKTSTQIPYNIAKRRTHCTWILNFDFPLAHVDRKVLDKLRVLKLNGCWNLAVCPNFIRMPHLEKLDFEYCERMRELDQSIGHLKSLTHLSLRDCHSLVELPQEVWQLISLEMLDLTRCYQITALPSLLGDSKPLKQLLLGKLKVLNLRHCRNLTMCPDFTSMPHLEKLDFGYCQKISELHPSIGLLKSLTHLSLGWCESLKELPEEVCQLTSLQKLDLSCCSQISTLPISMRDLKQLNLLSLVGCSSLEEVPECICSLLNLQVLNCRECRSLASLPNSIGNLKSLEMLDLSRTGIEELPDSIALLEMLEVLSIAHCKRLKFLPASAPVEPSKRQDYSLPLLPPSLTELHAEGCYKLETIADVSNAKGLLELDLRGCERLMDIPGIEKLNWLKSLKLGGCRSLSNSMKKNVQEGNFEHLADFSISGNLSISESSEARSLYFFLPKWLETGSLYLKLNESELDSVLVNIDITTDDARLLFQTSIQARLWRPYDHINENQVPKVKLGEYEEMMIVAGGGGFVGNNARRSSMMMHVAINGCLLLDGYLRSTTNGTFDESN
ncbi:TMV resistance protein [Nymphaea thermarum]|nr:TMV resistance protein [Nymphaea thermarum]